MKITVMVFRVLVFLDQKFSALIFLFLAVLRVFRPPYRLTHSFKMSREQKPKKCKLSNRFDGYWLQGAGGGEGATAFLKPSVSCRDHLTATQYFRIYKNMSSS